MRAKTIGTATSTIRTDLAINVALWQRAAVGRQCRRLKANNNGRREYLYRGSAPLPQHSQADQGWNRTCLRMLQVPWIFVNLQQGACYAESKVETKIREHSVNILDILKTAACDLIVCSQVIKKKCHYWSYLPGEAQILYAYSGVIWLKITLLAPLNLPPPGPFW